MQRDKLRPSRITNIKKSEVEEAKEILRSEYPDRKLTDIIFDQTEPVEETKTVKVKLDTVDYYGEAYYAIVTENSDNINLTGNEWKEFPYRASIDKAIMDAKKNHPSLTEEGIMIITVIAPAKDIDGTGWIEAQADCVFINDENKNGFVDVIYDRKQ